MKHSNILGWAQQNHFLVVEIDGKTMRVTPLSFEPMNVVSSDGSPVSLPITITQTVTTRSSPWTNGMIGMLPACFGCRRLS